MLSWVKLQHPFRILDLKICQGITMGSGDVDPMPPWACSSRMKGYPPQIFRVLYTERPCCTTRIVISDRGKIIH